MQAKHLATPARVLGTVMISWVREQRYRALLIKQLAINERNRIIIIPLYIEMCLLRSPHTKGVCY